MMTKTIVATATIAPAAIALAVLGLPVAATAQFKATPEQHQQLSTIRSACEADFRRLCQTVTPGGGRVLSCFQTHASELSPACRSALATARTPRKTLPAPSST